MSTSTEPPPASHAGLQFKTISYGGGQAVPANEFFALHDHLERSYPRVHQTLSREKVSPRRIRFPVASTI